MADAQPIWNRPARGARGPAPSHSRAEIVAAAIAIADADGLPAVSMRAVAAKLGTAAGGLYRYLSSRDDLLDLMTDRAVGELEPYHDTSGDWLDHLVALGRAQLDLHRRHPWLADVIQRPSAVGPHALSFFDRCLGVLAPLDAPTSAKFEAIALMTGTVVLFSRSAATGPNPFAGLDPTAHPHLAAALANPSDPGRQDLFDHALRGLLRGLLTP
ncbi:TetR/AcrR family transcriptional regulator [Asanoa siamensis]|uniref:TetR family transcriptional regulator n=1 Tax=Asanoa siamensis TaxID=926357 RepID=A0ABQ4CJ80_9ACTN|nr:TetR/AcrR family transcriptional regulator [Asanoa siamensis]GIF71346.1 TetR family transcriptional regulator [Asanoa siamensis]